jgi:hypothetical protein
MPLTPAVSAGARNVVVPPRTTTTVSCTAPPRTKSRTSCGESSQRTGPSTGASAAKTARPAPTGSKVTGPVASIAIARASPTRPARS